MFGGVWWWGWARTDSMRLDSSGGRTMEWHGSELVMQVRVSFGVLRSENKAVEGLGGK